MQPPPSPMSALALIDHAADLGLHVVQIADNLPLHQQSAAQLADIREHARTRAIQIEVGTRGIGEDHILRYLELARYFGSPILRAVIDSPGDEPSSYEVIARLSPLLPAFHEAGVVLALENHDRFDSSTFTQIIDGLGRENAGICLDTVNSFGALEGPDVVIRTLAPYAVNLHLKDFVIRRHPSMMGFEITGAPAGQGRLAVPSLLSTLREHRRDVSVILELWPAPEATMADTVAKEEQWTVDSIRYLRTLIED